MNRSTTPQTPRYATLRLIAIVAAVAAFLPLAGCGPRLNHAELGEIHYELPHIPGADEPYPLAERYGIDAPDLPEQQNGPPSGF